MNIKKGDKVVVISGADKGKEGIVQRAYPKLNKVVVEGVNVRKKHKKPSQSVPEGSIVDIYAPLDASKVMVIDPKTTRSWTARRSASPRAARLLTKEGVATYGRKENRR